MIRFLTAFTLLLALALWGAGYGFSVSMSGYESHGNCMDARDGHLVCALASFAHLSAVQSDGTRSKTQILLLLLAGAYVAAAVAVFVFIRPRWRLHPKSLPNLVQLPSLFQLLFSQGILHPKAP